MLRLLGKIVPAGLVFAAHGAAAIELDMLLPPGIPGFAEGTSVLAGDRDVSGEMDTGWQVSGVTIDPRVDLGLGYDTAPDGRAPGSPQAAGGVSVAVVDVAAGLGGYAAASDTADPLAPAQDAYRYTLALGERARLPGDVVSLAVAQIRTTQTAFALSPLAPGRPIAVTASEIEISDEHAAGMFTVTPRFVLAHAAFGGDADVAGLRAETRTDTRETLTTDYAPGGPARAVLELHATQSAYQAAALNAVTYAALAGVAEAAPAIWDVRLLAGAAWRRPVTGATMAAPVLEAAFDWMPDEADSASLTLVREIDDPDQETAAGYVLSQAAFSCGHELRRNVSLKASGNLGRAAYFRSREVETLSGAGAVLTWQLNSAVSLAASYAFSGRRDNVEPATSEHVISVTLSWTP